MVYVNKMTFVIILYYLFLETWAFQIVYLKLYCKVAAYLTLEKVRYEHRK